MSNIDDFCSLFLSNIYQAHTGTIKAYSNFNFSKKTLLPWKHCRFSAFHRSYKSHFVKHNVTFITKQICIFRIPQVIDRADCNQSTNGPYCYRKCSKTDSGVILVREVRFFYTPYHPRRIESLTISGWKFCLSFKKFGPTGCY